MYRLEVLALLEDNIATIARSAANMLRLGVRVLFRFFAARRNI
jgi:hypothetical protein